MNPTLFRPQVSAVAASLLLAFATQAGAQAAAPAKSTAKPASTAPAAAPADPRATIVKKVGGLTLEDVRLSPITGIYEISHGANISYVSGDGKYAIAGDLIDLDSDANLSESRRRAIRARMIGAIPDSEMVVYSPKDPPKYTVTVFTDIDCGYCRRLHSQMAEYNRLGIRVRYLFFPRSGPNTESWHKAEQVWCSSNRADALTRAKNGEALSAPSCPANNIVQRDYDLGQKLSVEGTPAIFLTSGEMLGGYAPPTQLAKYLKDGKM